MFISCEKRKNLQSHDNSLQILECESYLLDKRQGKPPLVESIPFSFIDYRKMELQPRTEFSRKCNQCGTTQTTLWRSGPDGPKSLCNACGIRWKRGSGLVKKRKLNLNPKDKNSDHKRPIKRSKANNNRMDHPRREPTQYTERNVSPPPIVEGNGAVMEAHWESIGLWVGLLLVVEEERLERMKREDQPPSQICSVKGAVDTLKRDFESLKPTLSGLIVQ